ncbi:MAG: AraC family transcriptional regulator [Chloroflexota bacterium]|nr:AraC family transcriptional regulator [Chloroflexota bacterium]
MPGSSDPSRSRDPVHEIRAWSLADLLLEWHRYAPGPAGTDVMHVHDTYQWCLSLDFPGEYRYRGARFPVPIGSLSVIHPGEVHASRDLADRPRPTSFRILYTAPRLIQAAAGSIFERPSEMPFFADPVILDQKLAADFLAFHLATEAPVTQLEPDTRLLFLLAALLRHAGSGNGPPRRGHEPGAVNRVRDYLDSHYADNPSLADLARLVDRSPFHLARAFRAGIGLPPHAYLIGVRICRAKELLAGGWPVARVAMATGFFDQSHLAHHFKRLVGVPPGRYALRRKNVQDRRQRTP